MPVILLALMVLSTASVALAQGEASRTLASIFAEIQNLEGANEPKCDATASRLEDFIYGTPLSDAARFRKNELQKSLVLALWHRAAPLATADGRASVSKLDVDRVAFDLLPHVQLANGDWEVAGPETLVVDATDKRQYSSVAYALRALLGVQQDQLRASAAAALPALESDAVTALKDFTDLYTLAALQVADRRARLAERAQLGPADVEEAWLALTNVPDVARAPEEVPAPVTSTAAPFEVIRRIIDQKVGSYATYNDVSNQVFVRNLQTYFARLPWPRDAELGNEFRDMFVAALVNFASDLWVGAERVARAGGHALIRAADVQQSALAFIPHQINEYEDALFFPRLPADQRIAIESYDMDAFRDSGTHWLYLQRALDAPGFAGTLEPDPFAAELLAENVAQFGVLVLRVAGMVGTEMGAARLHPDQIDGGLRLIQARIDAHAAAAATPPADEPLRSSGTPSAGAGTASAARFHDVTARVGIELEHRSSDWLNRLLRSFLPTDEPGVGNITIPPAFGGSGVAAEDVDGDGLPDVLILSGRGNRLYLNDGAGGFRDVTETAGLDWRRPDDNQPGEPRQPIIADLDNDGLQDILITYVDDAHRVYRNLGNARFQDVTDRATLGGAGLVGGPATVLDFDRDGLLDVYITYFGNYLDGVLPTLRRRNVNGLPNRLFRNTGSFVFEDVTEGSGVGDTGWAQAVAHTDLDGDGWQDLIVGNDFGVNAYYRNRGDGAFENLAAALGTDKPSYTMNVGIADLNDDTAPDFYISNIVTMNKDETYILPTEDTVMRFDPDKLANLRVVEANDLFLSGQTSDGEASYTLSDRVGRGYSSTGWSWDADFFDADNDGDDDLYVLNGMNEFAVYSSENPYYTDPLDNERRNVYIPVQAKESNVFFVNEGGRLQNASEGSGLDLLGNSRSAAYLDFDRDGDLDVVVNNYHGPAVFYRNDADRLGNNWLALTLIGDVSKGSPLDAIGARVIFTTLNGTRLWREVHGTIGYMSVHPKELHVGLGSETAVSAEIRWPNGEITRIDRLEANRRYRVDQASGTPEP